MLLLPDCGQSGASWQEAFLRGLGDALPVLRPDWPEGALRDEGGCTTEGLAAALREKLQGWAVRRVHVLGVGLGALVALELALGRRRVVERLVLVGGHSGRRTAVASPPWVREALASALGAPVEEQAEALRPLLRRGGGAVDAGVRGGGAGAAGGRY